MRKSANDTEASRASPPIPAPMPMPILAPVERPPFGVGDEVGEDEVGCVGVGKGEGGVEVIGTVPRRLRDPTPCAGITMIFSVLPW